MQQHRFRVDYSPWKDVRMHLRDPLLSFSVLPSVAPVVLAFTAAERRRTCDLARSPQTGEWAAVATRRRWGGRGGGPRQQTAKLLRILSLFFLPSRPPLFLRLFNSLSFSFEYEAKKKKKRKTHRGETVSSPLRCLFYRSNASSPPRSTGNVSMSPLPSSRNTAIRAD